MLPDLISLALFVKAVKLGSLSKAAQESHLSLSAASRRVALLEQHFAVNLLERNPKGVQPTLAGHALVRHATEILRQSALLHAEISDYANGAIGRVRLQANISAMSQQLPDQVASFSAAYPNIKLEIHEARSRDIIQAVYDGNADVGVVTSLVPLKTLHYELYCSDPLCAIVSNNNSSISDQVSFTELLAYDIVGLDNTATITRELHEVAQQAGIPLRLRLQVQSFEAVCRLVAAGLGVGVLPAGSVTPFLQVMPLRRIDLTDAWANRKMYVVMRNEQQAGPAQTLFEHLLPKPAH